MSFPRPRFLRHALALLPLLLAASLQAALNYATPYVFTTLAGSTTRGSADGVGADARFWSPRGLAVDQAGNLYVADQSNGTIRKITPSGAVSTLAGTAGLNGDPDVDGVGAGARFSAPSGLALDAAGNLYVSDDFSMVIRKVTPSGTVTTVAGVPSRAFGGFVDGPAASAQFNGPETIAIDATGIIFVADGRNNVIRQIGLNGMVSTLAGGQGRASGDQDGNGSAARFYYPSCVALAPDGTLVVVDCDNYELRRVTRSGEVTTITGRAWYLWNGKDDIALDGPVAVARFNLPYSAAVDASGNIFVVDRGSGLIRKVTPAGEVMTVAGDPAQIPDGSRVSVDGIGKDASFGATLGIAVDANGTLYVADGNMIRKGRPATGPVITRQPQNLSVTTGGSVQFSVTASGAPDPTYQWYFNGAVFSGATASTLSFSAARSADAGDYTVVVTNALGNITSAKATLTVTSAPPSGGSTGGDSSGGGKSGGGGGAPSLWFLLALAALAANRVRAMILPRQMRISKTQ